MWSDLSFLQEGHVEFCIYFNDFRLCWRDMLAVIYYCLGRILHTVVLTKVISQNVKAYTTMWIGIMGSGSLALLDWGSGCFTKKERESMSAVSFYHAETPLASIKQP